MNEKNFVTEVILPKSYNQIKKIVYWPDKNAQNTTEINLPHDYGAEGWGFKSLLAHLVSVPFII